MNGPIPTSDPKKFLFISIYGYSVDLAWQVQREGHEVRYCLDDSDEREIGNGFFPKVDDWKNHCDWADVVVFDDTVGQGESAHDLRSRGKSVIGGTPYTDRLEDDRAFGQEEMKKHGISILPYQQFTTFDEGISHITENPGKYVLKPCEPFRKELLFVGNEDDGSDVVRLLSAYKHACSAEIKTYQLQKKVAGGIEVGASAFFNGDVFITPICIAFEHKRLFPGELGVSTGEMGTSMFWSEPNRLFNATLKKMEPKLREEKYVGYIDINCIVNGQGIYPLEFTCRFGYPTISIQQEGILSPVGEFFLSLANHEPYQLKTKKGFQIGAYIVMPPFPYYDPETHNAFSKDMPVVFKKQQTDGVHIVDLKLVNDEWIITGTSGTVLVVTGSGMTMKEAQKQMYNRISNILIPNMYYRTDIGDRWNEDSDRLHAWGYLREQ
jgi:phosphoribosylamine---glycine ligase